MASGSTKDGFDELASGKYRTPYRVHGQHHERTVCETIT